ncbi:MAG: ABC transporter substrate binding protein [Xanthomonadales bacterium]|nr:ABC transporter substrate binding protein [Xanthomonadales bacterium]
MGIRLNRVIFAGLAAYAAGYCDLSHADDGHDVSITVVMSKENDARHEVLNGFQQHLSESGITANYNVEVVDADAPEHGFQANDEDGTNRIFLTLDTHAAEHTMTHQHDAKIISALVLNTAKFDMAQHTTGVLLNHSVEVQLEYLRRILPDVHRVGVLFNPSENEQFVSDAQIPARKMDIDLVTEPVNKPRDLPKALRSVGSNAQMIWGIADRIVLAPETIQHLLVYSFRNRLPLSGLSEPWVKAGALYALERDYFDIGIQCGEMAVKSLQGISLEKIPPSTPRKVLYVLNLKTARHMKLNLSPGIIEGAHMVFE